jgi:hypothetical protein
MAIQIVITTGCQSLGGYAISSRPMLVGRSGACDIRIPSSFSEVSSKHVLLKEEGNDLWILDGDGIKASTNGVYLNGSRLSPNVWIRIPWTHPLSLGNPNNHKCVQISIVKQMQSMQPVSTESRSALQQTAAPENESKRKLASENQARLNNSQASRLKPLVDHSNSGTEKKSALSTPTLRLSREEEESMSNVIAMLKDAYSFQTIDVLERIVTHEQEKIENEQALWRIGGAIIGAVLGAGDGFDLTDVGTSFAFSNIAGMAYSQASKEQRQFLKKIHSLWLIDQRSPVDLRRRLGEPIGRFVGYSSETSCFDPDGVFFANIHQNSSRGSTLVALGFAEDFASGFTDEMSREKMIEVFTGDEIENLRYQLYPIIDLAGPLKIVRTITDAEAKSKDPMYTHLHKLGSPFRLSDGDGDDQIVYKCSIPSHSDY